MYTILGFITLTIVVLCKTARYLHILCKYPLIPPACVNTFILRCVCMSARDSIPITLAHVPIDVADTLNGEYTNCDAAIA